MTCWCGHGPWHHQGYPYPAGQGYGPPPGTYYEPRPYRRRRHGHADAEELADYLDELEAEVTHIRRDLDELRRTDAAERLGQPGQQ